MKSEKGAYRKIVLTQREIERAIFKYIEEYHVPIVVIPDYAKLQFSIDSGLITGCTVMMIHPGEEESQDKQ